MDLANNIAGTVPARAQRLLREHIQAVLSQYELTVMDWSMLAVLADARNGVQHAFVAEQLHVKAPFVTALTGPLVKRQLVQSVTSQFDARGKLLALTPAGKKLRKTVEAALNRRLSQLLAGLTATEIAGYYKFMTTVNANNERLRG